MINSEEAEQDDMRARHIERFNFMCGSTVTELWLWRANPPRPHPLSVGVLIGIADGS